jgi:predicted kinase
MVNAITQPELNRIFIPRNTLVVLCGPAGCGKSTFAARHFLATQIVSSDDCRARVSDDPTNQGVSGHAFDLLYFIIEKRLTLERLTAADATNLDRRDRKSLVKIARWFDFNAAILVFDIPLEVCLARNANRARKVPEDALRRQFETLEATLTSIDREGFDYVYVLDEREQDTVKVEVGPPKARRRPRKQT